MDVPELAPRLLVFVQFVLCTRKWTLFVKTVVVVAGVMGHEEEILLVCKRSIKVATIDGRWAREAFLGITP